MRLAFSTVFDFYFVASLVGTIQMELIDIPRLLGNKLSFWKNSGSVKKAIAKKLYAYNPSIAVSYSHCS